ncbi:MAG: hypothetical protein M5U34_24765 [Chloroflexi bacterium]|nr:hypothetical protein [Chloroflexota bacterium]
MPRTKKLLRLSAYLCAIFVAGAGFHDEDGAGTFVIDVAEVSVVGENGGGGYRPFQRHILLPMHNHHGVDAEARHLKKAGAAAQTGK